MESKGDNILIGKWKFKVDDMPEVIETYKSDGSFFSEFVGTEHNFSGKYSFDTTCDPMIADLEVSKSTLDKLPLGIYKSIFTIFDEGKKMKSCTSEPGEERPKDFNEKNTIISEKIDE